MHGSDEKLNPNFFVRILFLGAFYLSGYLIFHYALLGWLVYLSFHWAFLYFLLRNVEQLKDNKVRAFGAFEVLGIFALLVVMIFLLYFFNGEPSTAWFFYMLAFMLAIILSIVISILSIIGLGIVLFPCLQTNLLGPFWAAKFLSVIIFPIGVITLQIKEE